MLGVTGNEHEVSPLQYARLISVDTDGVYLISYRVLIELNCIVRGIDHHEQYPISIIHAFCFLFVIISNAKSACGVV